MSRKTLSEEEKQQKRRLILENALRLFGERGYEGSAMEDIAKGAQLSTGTLYLYFPGKLDIYKQLCEEALETLDRAFDDALRLPVPDIRTRLYMIFYSYIHFYKSDPALYKLLLHALSDESPLPSGDSSLSERNLEILKRLEAPLIEGVMHGVIKPCDTFKTILTIRSMFDGVLQIPSASLGESPADTRADCYAVSLDLILNGILV